MTTNKLVIGHEASVNKHAATVELVPCEARKKKHITTLFAVSCHLFAVGAK